MHYCTTHGIAISHASFRDFWLGFSCRRAGASLPPRIDRRGSHMEGGETDAAARFGRDRHAGASPHQAAANACTRSCRACKLGPGLCRHWDEPGHLVTALDTQQKTRTGTDARPDLPPAVEQLKTFLGDGKLLLVGDSIAEEFGERYLKNHSIPVEYANHTMMRGANPEEIRKQVFTRADAIKDDVQQKIKGAKLLFVSGGKNILRDNNYEYVASEVRTKVLEPMLHAMPADLPMLYVTPTTSEMVGTDDEIADHLKDLQTETFKIIKRGERELEWELQDFRELLHLKPESNEKLLQAVVRTVENMTHRTAQSPAGPSRNSTAAAVQAPAPDPPATAGDGRNPLGRDMCVQKRNLAQAEIEDARAQREGLEAQVQKLRSALTSCEGLLQKLDEKEEHLRHKKAKWDAAIEANEKAKAAKEKAKAAKAEAKAAEAEAKAAEAEAEAAEGVEDE